MAGAAPDADIASGAPSVTTYGVALALLALAAVATFPSWRLVPKAPPGVLAFPVFAVLCLLFVWERTPERVSGVAQLALGVLALIFGTAIAGSALAVRRGQRTVAYAVLAIVALEALVAMLQRLGFAINPMKPELAELMGSRVNGTLNHPNNLGKSMLILVVLSLGMSTIRARGPRVAARAAWMLAFVPLILSGGRANLVAAVLTVVFWNLLSTSRRSLAARLGIPLLLVVALLPFIGGVVERFEADPEGGPRQHLTQTALDQIALRPMWGTGPNAYVTVVRDYDPIVAAGYPVHNTYLLTVAEFGIPGALIYWFPVAAVVLAAWRSRTKPGLTGTMATAVIASVPGLYVVTTTGWAMLSGSMLPLWCLVFGLTYGLTRTEEIASPRAGDLKTHPTRT
jgi:O-antigen ligase